MIMMATAKKRFILLLFLFPLSLFCMLTLTPGSLSTSAKVYDQELDWQVLEGEHFSVIFPGISPFEKTFDYQQIAIHIAEIAEDIYQKITPQFGEPFQPNKKITIILEDFSDSVYGYASAIPHRSIRLNLTAPGFKSFNTKFESWLKILIAHEYTHLAHFDMTNKGTTFLRFFLGQIIAPNALQPLWSIEGLAIYNESKWSTGGRLKDSRYEMYLRSDFQSNQLKNLDQIQGSYLVSWPGGNAPYIYGQSLIHFIAQQFGEEKLIAISKEFSTFPYSGINRALKKTLGMDQNDLFEKWKKFQSKQYQQQIEQVKQFGNITESLQLTNHQYWVDDPVWLPNANDHSPSLLYKVYTPQLYPTIREYNLSSKTTKEEKILIRRTSGHGTSYSLSPDQQYLIYTKLTQYKQYYSYHDLYLYHLKIGKQFRISEGMRIKDPSWHPDHNQNKIAAIVNQAGSNNLVIFSLNPPFLDDSDHAKKDYYHENDSSEPVLLSFSDLIYLTDFTHGTQISQPTWSPLNNQIAFSLWHSGYQDLYILTLDKHDQIHSIKAITLDSHTDISPNWSPDGQYLYFSSDRSGIYNLYAYNLKNEQLFLLTNVTTGAFEPSVSPNGKEVAFIQYHSSGYELHLINTDQLLWKLVDKPILDFSVPQPVIHNHKIFIPHSQLQPGNSYQNELLSNAKQNASSYPIKEYSPWNSILPTYWIPYLSITSHDLYLGFSSIAQDQLKFYTAPFTLARGILNQSTYYDFYFMNNAHHPAFSFFWQGETSFSSQIQATINFPSEGYTSIQDSSRYFYKDLSLGFHSEWYLMEEKEGGNLDAAIQKVNSLILRYNYDDTETYQASIGPEIGHSFSLSYQHANQNMGSDITYHKILFDGRKYFPLSVNQQVLALRLVAGAATEGSDEKDHFYLGGNANHSQLSSTSSYSFPLRGFQASSFSGNHLLLTSLEYRFPIRTIEDKIGFDWASIFLERISGTFFIDAGHTWNKTSPSTPLSSLSEEINVSLGVELNFKFNRAHNDPFILTIGAGKAITEPTQFQFYAQTGISF